MGAVVMNGDLISRSALLEELSWLKSVVNITSVGDVEDMMERVRNAPAVEAEPVVHAHWVTWKEQVWHLCELRMLDRHYCSNCGKPSTTKLKRCPECGAHMDEEVTNG